MCANEEIGQDASLGAALSTGLPKRLPGKLGARPRHLCHAEVPGVQESIQLRRLFQVPSQLRRLFEVPSQLGTHHHVGAQLSGFGATDELALPTNWRYPNTHRPPTCHQFVHPPVLTRAPIWASPRPPICAGWRRASHKMRAGLSPHTFRKLTMSFADLLSRLAGPVIQAPMAGVQNHRLTAAVCEAGGLGSLAAATLSPEGLRAELQALRDATAHPYNVNFFCHAPPVADPAQQAAWQQALTPYYRDMGLDPASMPSGAGRVPFDHDSADVLEAFRPAVVSFHFGLPAPDLLARVKSWGSWVLSSATTVSEAVWLQAHGADAVIAQGLEAGGHRGMFLTDDLSTQMGTFALLPQIVQAVQLPVIAAGGIASAQGVAAAQALGAAGVQIGTAYLCSHEATTSALHRAALQSPDAQHTALTRLFSGRPARGIVNRLMRELGALSPAAPAFPLATAAMAPLRAAAEAQGLTDFTPLWAGQNAASVQSRSATDITRSFVQAWHSGV